MVGESDKEKKVAKDLILDIQFDHFGTRFATASADQHIRVYKRNGKGEFSDYPESSWVAHSATIWHLDWAHPHHGTILASCSFDKHLKIWIPPETGKVEGKIGKENEWQEIDKHSVDKRGSVTDVRFSPVWFPRSEDVEDGFEGSSKVYIGCCTSDGQAKIYEASTPVSKATRFLEQKSLHIIKNGNNNNFRCTTLDWSRLRQSQQLIAIGSEGNDGCKSNEDIFRLYRYISRSPAQVEDCAAGDAAHETHRWKLLEKQSKEVSNGVQGKPIEGPVNLMRFAANIGSSVHLLAIAATNIHIVSIDPQNDFEILPMKLVYKDPLAVHEKCWRLCWDSCLRLFSVHGDRVYLWNQNYESSSENNEWIAEPFPS